MPCRGKRDSYKIVSRLRCGFENRRSLVRSSARPIFFLRIDDSHCDRIYSSLTAFSCFDNGYVGKQPVALEEYFAEYWLKELKEAMDRCNGRSGITKILLKTALNTIQFIKQYNHIKSSVSSFVRMYFVLCAGPNAIKLYTYISYNNPQIQFLFL